MMIVRELARDPTRYATKDGEAVSLPCREKAAWEAIVERTCQSSRGQNSIEYEQALREYGEAISAALPWPTQSPVRAPSCLLGMKRLIPGTGV